MITAFIQLCDDFELLPNGQLVLKGIGGVIFTAPFPRGLCYVHVKLTISPLNRHRHHMVRVALVPDDLPGSPALYTPAGQLIDADRPISLRSGDVLPVEMIFDLNKAIITKPGHYSLRIYCDDQLLGETKFELKAPG